MTKNIGNRKLINIFYVMIIVIVLFSNIFANQLSRLLYITPNYKYNNRTEIHFIDVGQGDAIAIKFATGKVMLIDSGIPESSYKLKRYLDNIVLDNNKTIDYVVLTHIDTDHSGNMKMLLESYNIGTLYRPKIYSTAESADSVNTSTWYNEIIDMAIDKEIKMVFNECGVELNEGMTKLSWLSPININHNDNIESNNFSAVIKLVEGEHSVLFTGDISSEIEEELLKQHGNNALDVDILKVAHHGSSYSTCEEFLYATSPKYAIISVGNNTYGHPSNALLYRILQYDKNTKSNLFKNVITTLENGNIILELADTIKISNIKNIDNYSFGNYFAYTVFVVVFVSFAIIKPYIKYWRRTIRFYIQNKQFDKKYANREDKKMSEFK